MKRLAMFALLVLLGASASAAESRPGLGRLFTTPAERAEIDSARRRPPPAASSQGAASGASPSAASVTVNGLISRSDGRRVVWINGAKVDDGGVTAAGVRVLFDRATAAGVPLLLPGRPLPIVLKPGQTYATHNGAQRDAYAVPPKPAPIEQEAARGGPDR
jgi:hypothetical protein